MTVKDSSKMNIPAGGTDPSLHHNSAAGSKIRRLIRPNRVIVFCLIIILTLTAITASQYVRNKRNHTATRDLIFQQFTNTFQSIHQGLKLTLEFSEQPDIEISMYRFFEPASFSYAVASGASRAANLYRAGAANDPLLNRMSRLAHTLLNDLLNPVNASVETPDAATLEDYELLVSILSKYEDMGQSDLKGANDDIYWSTFMDELEQAIQQTKSNTFVVARSKL